MELLVIMHRRRALRRERRFRDRLDPLSLSDNELLSHYRFPRHELQSLIEELDPALRRRTRRMHAIPTHTQVLLALRFFASGSFQQVVGDIGGPAQSSISRIMKEVIDVLNNKAVEEIKMPSSPQELQEAAQQFSRICNFPRVIGVIGGTHIAIKMPTVDEAIYVNHERYHSLNVQVVCDANKLIISYCARFPGSTHDAYVWQQSDLRQRFERGEFGDYILLGDSSYPLEPFLMTPVHNPGTSPEERYNAAQKSTRIILEQTFRVLKNRFRCLHKSGAVLQYPPIKCAKIITSCMLLHNRCIKLGIPLPQELEDEQSQEDPAERGHRGRGRAARDEIIRNFFT